MRSSTIRYSIFKLHIPRHLDFSLNGMKRSVSCELLNKCNRIPGMYGGFLVRNRGAGVLSGSQEQTLFRLFCKFKVHEADATNCKCITLVLKANHLKNCTDFAILKIKRCSHFKISLACNMVMTSKCTTLTRHASCVARLETSLDGNHRKWITYYMTEIKKPHHDEMMVRGEF